VGPVREKNSFSLANWDGLSWTQFGEKTTA
jgi:hypothetical protein